MTPLFLSRKWILIFGLMLFPAVVHANIGDTIPQLRKRYGKEKVIAGQCVFEQSGYSITVYLDGDHSGMEIFTHNTSDPAKSELTKKEIDTILDRESDGYQWNPLQVHSGRTTWMRSDNAVLARFSPNPSGKPEDASVLVIMANAK